MSVCRYNYYLSLCLALFFCAARVLGQSSSDYDRGVAEFRAGDYSSAAALFARVEAAAPGKTDAALYRAKCLVHIPDFAGAEQGLRSYLDANPESSDALYMLGFVLNRENRPSESLDVYTRAAAISQPSSDDLKIVGLDYVLLGDYPDAIKWLEKSVAFDNKNKDAWYYLGRAYYTRSRLTEARRAFLVALKLDPRDARAENGLGLIFESSAQPERAIQAYKDAISWDRENPHKSEQPYVNLGSLLLEQGRTKEALEPLEIAVQLAPASGYCHLRLGAGYFREGQMENALSELSKATELDPANASAHYQLGRVYRQMHQLDRAKAEFEKAVNLQNEAASSAARETH